MDHSKMTDVQRQELSEICNSADRYLGSIIHVEIDEPSTFAINSKVELMMTELNMTLGTMQRDSPRGIANANRIRSIAKWHNISRQDRSRLDGFVLCEDNRDGNEAFICLFK